MKSASKTLIRETAKLKQKKFRDLRQHYLISGLNAVQGAQESSRQPLAVFIMRGREEWLNKFPRFVSAPVYLLTEKEFSRISDEKVPQGIALLMERPPTDFNALRTLPPMALYLEAVNDPGNLGTIIRSALWFGVDTIFLSPGSADPFQPKVTRASAGAVAQVRLFERVGPEELKRLQKEKKVRLAATVVRGGVALNAFTPPSDYPLLLAFGSEAHGLSKEVQELSDWRLTIPPEGPVESLNLAISAALCLYELTRKK